MLFAGQDDEDSCVDTNVDNNLTYFSKISCAFNICKTTLPEAFQYLINADNVLLTPHVAGWTEESNIRLAQTIVDKIKFNFC